MIPTTPNGTRTWRSSSPFGSVYPRTTSPTGSDSPARSSSPDAIASTRLSSRRSRSTVDSGVPASRAAATSSAFASTILPVFSRSAAAIARSAASLSARDAADNAYDASRARRHTSSTALMPFIVGRGTGANLQPITIRADDRWIALRRACFRTGRLRRWIAMACRFGGSEDDEVVAVDHLALVLGAELAGELVGRAALQGGDLGSVVVHQAAGDDRAVRRDEVDGVAGGEGALDAADAGREE